MKGGDIVTQIIIALIGAGGSAIGAIIGIIVNTKLVNFRLEKLEEKVNKHNSIIERTFNLERKTEVLAEKISVANHRIEDLEYDK